MNRRDFLSFKVVREPERTLDLECHALYMRWVDATRPRPPAEEPDPSRGEPPAQFEAEDVDAIIGQLARDLSAVRRLRVLDAEWLQTTGLGERVAPLLDAFRARGGTVLFDSTAAY